MANKINFSDYPASGVYFLEIDNSVISTSSSRTALRLAVGFNMRGPFNRPVYVAGADDCNKFFGPIDRKLERNGCFTNRMVRTLVRKAPVYVLNLLNVEEKGDKDTVGMHFLEIYPSATNFTASKEVPYADLYDKTKFWVTDDSAFVDNTFAAVSEVEKEKAPFFALGNCGTKDISVIVKKSEGLTGYNVTFLEYFGSKEEIPYKWINPNDYVSDYFVDVILVSGKWGDANSLSKDVVWGKYFDEDGVKADMLNKFLRLDAVNVIKQWTGCLIPNFQDKQGAVKSIDYVVNSKCNETGLMFGVNEDAMEYLALAKNEGVYEYFYDEDGTGIKSETNDASVLYTPDLVGNGVSADSSSYSCLSAICDTTNMVKVVNVLKVVDKENEFITPKDEGISIGDFVKAKSGQLTKVIKKRASKSGGITVYSFTASEPVAITENEGGKGFEVEVHKSIQSQTKSYKFIDLKGLKLSTRHMPGYNEDGQTDKEGGVAKIYSMLENAGIRKGLLNDDVIDFRYIIDTMAFGIGENCGGKKYLADFAKEKGHCTAIINAPSMSQFAASDAPFFGETTEKACFDVAYIPQGGNPDIVYDEDCEYFTLPGEDYGATHVGVFAPFLKYAERGRTILVPPAADVANTFMNKFTGGDPYVTVANLNGILVNGEIAGVEYQFDETDRGHLETMGINPIIERSGQFMIYGDKTAYQTVNSDLSYLHVRELLNTIQLACKSVLDDYVFTYNIPTTRAEIITRINPILKSMKDSGALVRYEIQCDDINNDKEVIDNKFCIVDIGVWISQNMEKIVVPITINRSTTA